jgi:hypothetical protein
MVGLIRPTSWRGRVGPTAKMAWWSKPVGAQHAYLMCGTALGASAGNNNKVGGNGVGQH